MRIVLILAAIIGIVVSVGFVTGSNGSSFLLLATIGSLFYFFVIGRRLRKKEEKKNLEHRKRAQLAHAEEMARKAKAERRSDAFRNVSNNSARAVSYYTEIPGRLLEAEESLDDAEAEYRRGAFSPFWQNVEEALVSLGAVYDSIDGIAKEAEQFSRFAGVLGKELRPFPVAKSDSNALRKLANAARARLDQIVKESQTDFQFSSIYEQRKTNAILMRGFTNLGQAIDGLKAQLSSSFSGLSAQLEQLEHGLERRHRQSLDVAKELDESISASARATSDHAAKAALQREKIAARQAKKANEQLAMLDNIQRRRRPIDQERGPRTF